MTITNLNEFLDFYNPNDAHNLITIDLLPKQDASPFILVKCGRYSAVVSLMAVPDSKDGEPYLDIDVHPFVDGELATASVFGMTTGMRHEGFDKNDPTILTTSLDRPSTNLVVVLVGEQGTSNHKEN